MRFFFIIFFILVTVPSFNKGNLVVGNRSLYAADEIIDVNIEEIRKRRMVESNGIAETLCLVMNLMRSDITKAIVAMSLFAVGIGAFFGKLSLAWFLSFAVGCASFFGSISTISFLAPFSNIGMGCDCKEYLIVGRKEDGTGYIKIRTMLDKNCNPTETDSGSINQKNSVSINRKNSVSINRKN